MKWVLLSFSIAVSAASTWFQNPWLLSVACIALIVVGIESYLRHAKVQALESNHAAIEEAFAVLQKNESILNTHLKRLEDKFNALISNDPVARPIKRR